MNEQQNEAVEAAARIQKRIDDLYRDANDRLLYRDPNDRYLTASGFVLSANDRDSITVAAELTALRAENAELKELYKGACAAEDVLIGCVKSASARADALAKELHELKQSIRVEGMDPDGSIWEHADKLHKDLENHKVMLENACLDKRDLKQQLAGKNVALAEANEIKIAFSDAVDRLEKERDSLNQQLAAKDTELDKYKIREEELLDGLYKERDELRAQLARAGKKWDELLERLDKRDEQLATARTVLEQIAGNGREWRYASIVAKEALAQIAPAGGGDNAITENGQVWGGAEL